MTKIKVSIELEVDDDRAGILNNIFAADAEKLGDELKPFLTAACHEYLDMFTGAAPITTATDVRERRLVAIILHGLKAVPQATLVAKLFKLPDTSASNLLRTVSAKHQDRIGAIYDAGLLALVDAATVDADKDDDKFYVVIRDAGQVRSLRTLLQDSPVPQTPLRLQEETANRYHMDKTTRDFLKKALAP